MAHVGQELALGRAGRLGFDAGVAQLVGQPHQAVAARFDLAHLAQRDAGEDHHHRQQGAGECQANPVVLGHLLLPFGDLSGHPVRGRQHHRVDRLVEGLQFGQQRARGLQAQRGMGVFAQVNVGTPDKVVDVAQQLRAEVDGGQQPLRPVAAQQQGSADEDVVAQLQPGVAGRLVDFLVQLLAQPQGFDLHLEQAQHQVIVLVSHRLRQQRVLARLHEGRGQHRGQQQQAGDAEPNRQPMQTGVGDGLARWPCRWIGPAGIGHCRSIAFSCQTQRL